MFYSKLIQLLKTSLQAAQRQSEDAIASGRLLADRDVQEVERLRAQLAGLREDRDLEVEALTEERDRLDAALAVCLRVLLSIYWITHVRRHQSSRFAWHCLVAGLVGEAQPVGCSALTVLC